MRRKVIFELFLCAWVLSGCALLPTEPSLRDYATQRNICIGAAIMPEHLEEIEYAKTVAKEFNILVPENHLKWSYVHPGKNRYDFSKADTIIEFAVKNGMKVRGHTLVWHRSIPEWLVSCADTENATVHFSREDLENILKKHIKTIVTRYKQKIQYWDVLNEIFTWNPDSGELRKTFWYKALNMDYIEKALIWAHEADEEAKLFINEYHIEEKNPKSDALYDLIKELKKKGIPVDGIGVQLHLDTTKKPDFENIETNMKRFIDLGLEVQFTEIDVSIPGNVTQEQLEFQAKIYEGLMDLALKYPEITAFITWGVTDKYFRPPGFDAGVSNNKVMPGSALLFDEKYRRKSAYHAIKQVLSDKTALDLQVK